MPIRGLEKHTTKDYPGKDAAVVFYGGCNYRCPHCQNPGLVENKLSRIREEDILRFLEKRIKWLDGVVISGGEPTTNLGLEGFLRKIKGLGYSIKLDTNGKNFGVLGELKTLDLVDYVAMDVKAPSYLYAEVVNGDVDLRDDVEKGMCLTTQFPDYEFRTTIAPIVREDGIEFLGACEVGDIAKWIAERTDKEDHKYFLQKFVPRKNGLLDSRLEEFPETPEGLMLEAREKAGEYLPLTEIR